MEILKCIFMLIISREVKGMSPSQCRGNWPLEDCHGEAIDMIFVPDISCQIGSQPKQMKLFSNLVDVFSPSTELTLSRLRVGLVIPLYNISTDTVTVDNKIGLGSYNNKSSLKVTLEKDSKCTNAAKARIHKAVKTIIQSVFINSTYQRRPRVTRVIIMVIHGMHLPDSFKEDLNKAQCISTNKEVMVFFVIVGTEAASRLQPPLPYTGIVLGENLDDNTQLHHIPIRLCKKCFAGWFNVIIDIRPITTTVSCYKLSNNQRDLNWIDANELCKEEMSHLVSIETATEQRLLRNVLPYEINSLISPLNSTGNLISVYIGLRRRQSSIGQRFRWISKKPLVHPRWSHLHPQGGSTIGCVKWDFPAKEVATAALIRVSENNTTKFVHYSEDMLDGWSSVGCGNAVSPFYLCEVKNDLRGASPPFEIKEITLSMPNRDSILAAIKKGELGFRLDFPDSFILTSILALYRDDFSFSGVFVNHDLTQNMSLDNLNMFFCDNFTQIPYSMVCDHVINCTNEADELLCGYTYRGCNSHTEFTCSNMQCIPIASKCDLYKDCLDGSDEDDCITCSHARCGNARCLPKHWFGDGEIDCNSCLFDGSLENEAQSVLDSDIDKCVFICNRTQCVYTYMLNDSVMQCRGPEGPLDETIGALESTFCYSDLDNVTKSYTNWGPKCIYIKDRYGEPLGCRNMKHLDNCSSFICPEGYYKCPMSYCIPTHYIKNNEYDCANGEDEDDFILLCPGYFRCAHSGICLHPDHVCDRQIDCLKGDDEMNCFIACREGFLCLAGTVTVSSYNREIPLTDLDFVTPATRYLDLSGINVSAVFPAFPIGLLKNVINLSLSECSVTNLEPRTMGDDTRGLWWLDLSYNLIRQVPSRNIFKSMYALQFLNLSHNEQLITVAKDAFSPYRSYGSVLKVLDLSYTALHSIQSSLLNLNKLERLILRNTRIATIPYDMFPDHLTLHLLDLRGLTINDLYPDMFKNLTIKSYLLTDSFKLCCPQIHSEGTDVKVCTSAKDPFSSCSDLMSQEILRILLWVSGILAIVGNTVVIAYRLAFDNMIFRMAYGHFIMHLSFADLFMGVYLIIISAADTYYRDSYVWDEYDWRNSAACQVAGFLSTLSSETSTFFIFLITLDRFFAMRFPFRQLKTSGKLITLACMATWALGFMIASIPLLPYFDDWDIYNTNGMCLGLPLTNRHQPGWQFSTAIFIFLNFFLFILIAFGQLAIYKSVFAMRMNQSKLTNASFRRSQDLAIAKNLFLVVATDFMCWFPIGVMGLLTLSGYEIGPDAYAWSAVLVLPINSAINPLLYTVPAVTRKLRQYKDGVTRQRSKSQ